MRALAYFAAAVSFVTLSASASCGGSDSTGGAGPTVIPDAGTPEHVDVDSSMPVQTCSAGKMLCGTDCVDTKTDVKNCGGCAKPCLSDQLCTASKCSSPTGYAARKFYLGDTDRAGASDANAWKSYGRNIDGIVSVGATPNGECTRQAGASASSADDGIGGIDNAFGKTIIPFLKSLSANPSMTANTVIEGGGQTLLLDLGTAPKTDLAAFALGLETASATIAPQWDGRDSRSVTAASSTAGKASTIFAGATITAGVLATGDSTTPYVLSFTMAGASLDLPIHVARVSMTLSADHKTATNGTISGVVGTEEMVSAFQKVAGSISVSLCSGSTLDTIKQTIRQASDILVDGTQDAATECNGISLGIGFDAVTVAVDKVDPPVAPPKDPCVP